MPREPLYRDGDEEGAGPGDPVPSPVPSAPSPGPDERASDDSLRPRRLADVVGQKAVVGRLQIMLDATRRRREPLGHLLLDGPPGLGKTTLATVVPAELGVDFQITSGPALKAPKDLVPYLTNAAEGSVLFIDEIHRLPPTVEEYLYPAMEDFRLDLVLGEGVNARTVSLTLKPFTVIGATTRSGMLTAPLRDRFVHRESLTHYAEDELSRIVTVNAGKLGLAIDAEGAGEIARRCRGTPRRANNLLRWSRDFAEVHAKRQTLDGETARAALAMREVDRLGLDEQDRRYLTTLVKTFSGGPAGLQTLSHSLAVPPDTLEDEVEPFLLRAGLVKRTPRGRTATAAAFEHLGLGPDQGPQPENLFDDRA